jgi:hypothetical protein
MNKIELVKKISPIALGFLLSTGSALAVTISTNIPGMTAAGSPSEFVDSFYKFSLMISGVLAFGAIVYGGVKYTLAAGNPSGQSEGKDWIKGALTGLLLLIGAYTILNIINPDLTKLALLKPPPVGSVGGGTITVAAGSPPPSGCRTGSCNLCIDLLSCNANPGCTPTTTAIGTFICAGSTQSCSAVSCTYCNTSSTCSAIATCSWTGSSCTTGTGCGPSNCGACTAGGDCEAGDNGNYCVWQGFSGPCVHI